MGKTIRTPYIFWSSVQQEIVQQKTRSSKRLISLGSTETSERQKSRPEEETGTGGLERHF